MQPLGETTKNELCFRKPDERHTSDVFCCVPVCGADHGDQAHYSPS